MLNTPANFHTDRALRTATITVGAFAGITLVAGYLYSASNAGGSFQLTGQILYNGIVFGGAIAWFVTNALRWLQERLLRPWNHIIFGTAALASLVVGARIALDIATDPPNDTPDTVYQAILASSLLAAGAIAAISALHRPSSPDEPAFTRFSGAIRKLAEEPTPGSTALSQVSRASAIGGGIVFAVAHFATPTVIPAAVAITCMTRYASTWNGTKTSRVALLIAVAIAVIAIHLVAIILFPEEPLYSAALVASAFLMLVALATSAVSL